MTAARLLGCQLIGRRSSETVSTVGLTIAAWPDLATFAAMLAAAVLLDALVRPRALQALALRSWSGMALLALQMTAVFGLFLAFSGSVHVSAALALALLALLAVASNAKHAMLGEPLLFSDLALVGAVFRHPQFYLSAVSLWQRIAAGLAALALLLVLALLFVPDPLAHLAGAALIAGALGLLMVCLNAPPWRDLAREPAAEADVRKLGLTPTLMLYWLRWRRSRDPMPCTPLVIGAFHERLELLVVVQCESFADPVELFGDASLALPALTAARDSAFQHGRLEASGFGAYTMRTEYGVLFGRDERALGFRRYDPFLTALGEASYALPARLGSGWRSLFLHPHDMRFYGRDRIMPAGGFVELVGEDRFAAPGGGEGRYVTDAAMADVVLARARAAERPSLLYAVTMENHGPWAPDAAAGGDLVSSYLRLVRHSDAMLARLVDGVGAMRRPAVLVFFGDHRPSIPGATAPGGDRHTPYVMLRFDEEGQVVRGPNRRVDLTPAGLHHAVLDAVAGRSV